jgi:hypothetical protein
MGVMLLLRNSSIPLTVVTADCQRPVVSDGDGTGGRRWWRWRGGGGWLRRTAVAVMATPLVWQGTSNGSRVGDGVGSGRGWIGDSNGDSGRCSLRLRNY